MQEFREELEIKSDIELAKSVEELINHKSYRNNQFTPMIKNILAKALWGRAITPNQRKALISHYMFTCKNLGWIEDAFYV